MSYTMYLLSVCLLLSAIFCGINARTLPFQIRWLETDLDTNGTGTVKVGYTLDQDHSDGLRLSWSRTIKPSVTSYNWIEITQDDPYISIDSVAGNTEETVMIITIHEGPLYVLDLGIDIPEKEIYFTNEFHHLIRDQSGFPKKKMSLDQVEVLEAPDAAINFNEGDTKTLRYKLRSKAAVNRLFLGQLPERFNFEEWTEIWNTYGVPEINGVHVINETNILDPEGEVEYDIQVTFSNMSQRRRGFYIFRFHADHPNGAKESLRMGTYFYFGEEHSLLPFGELEVRMSSCHGRAKEEQLLPESESCVRCMAIGNPQPSEVSLTASDGSGGRSNEVFVPEAVRQTLVLQDWAGKHVIYTCRAYNDIGVSKTATLET